MTLAHGIALAGCKYLGWYHWCFMYTRSKHKVYLCKCCMDTKEI